MLWFTIIVLYFWRVLKIFLNPRLSLIVPLSYVLLSVLFLAKLKEFKNSMWEWDREGLVFIKALETFISFMTKSDQKLIIFFFQNRAIFASGSPFDPYTLPNGKQLVPGQGNNAYVFPGVALGVTTFGVRHISDDIFLEASKVNLFRPQPWVTTACF